jgi:hypothetical protein
MDSPNEECPICLSPISTNITDKYITQCCKKTFHHTCYIECMKIKTECPLCRAGQVVIFVNPITMGPYGYSTITNNNNNSLCCELYRYWGTVTVVCGIFMCCAVFIAMTHYSSKN